MNRDLYYTPPPDNVFEEMRGVAIEIWNEYDNKYGYVDGKVARIKDIKNVQDNFMYIFSMFDHVNQRKVVAQLSEAAKNEVFLRAVAGGQEQWYLDMIGLKNY